MHPPERRADCPLNLVSDSLEHKLRDIYNATRELLFFEDDLISVLKMQNVLLINALNMYI